MRGRFRTRITRTLLVIPRAISTSCSFAAQEPESSRMITADFVQPNFSISIPVEFLERLRSIGDFVRVDDAVMIRIQCADQWRNGVHRAEGMLTVALESFHSFEPRPSSFKSAALKAHFIALAFQSARWNRAILVTEMMFGTIRSFHSGRMRRTLWTFRAFPKLETFAWLVSLGSFAPFDPLSPLEAFIVVARSAAALFRKSVRTMFTRPGERFDGVIELLAINHSVAILVHRREERPPGRSSIRARTRTAAAAFFAFVARWAGRLIGVLRVQVCHWQREPQCHQSKCEFVFHNSSIISAIYVLSLRPRTLSEGEAAGLSQKTFFAFKSLFMKS
jgi:hypothetical protein